VTNGHVYPEVSSSKTEAPYAERKYLYRNLRNGRFEDISDKGGPGITTPVAGRGCAFGDYDNDGDIDVIVNCVNSLPQLLRCDSQWKRSWIKVKTIGVKSNRTGIGARVRVLAKTQKGAAEPLLQVDEVRSGGSYYSQSDLRLHFGLDQAQIVDSLEVRWPSGHVDIFRNLAVNHLHVITEGAKDPQSVVIGH
jgi:enediyne biosynthesis protein E4